MRKKQKQREPAFGIQIAKLLNVKTIVTFVITYVFARLSLSGAITPDVAMPIITMVMAFYFGTQHAKKAEELPDSDEEKPPDHENPLNDWRLP